LLIWFALACAVVPLLAGAVQLLGGRSPVAAETREQALMLVTMGAGLAIGRLPGVAGWHGATADALSFVSGALMMATAVLAIRRLLRLRAARRTAA